MLSTTWTRLIASGAVLAAMGCSDRPDVPTGPSRSAPDVGRADRAPSSTIALVRQLTAARGIAAMPPAPQVRKSLVRLGQALAFDKLLSGNRDISCMTCHLPAFSTGDGRSLSVGQGAQGLGPQRLHPKGVFIPRNAPPLFNLGAMMHLFWDGRVAVDSHGNFQTPAGAQLTREMTRVFEFGAVSAIGMFPVTNRAEMRATGDNELAAIPDENLTAIWAALMRRIGSIREYREMFEEAYPGTPFERMTFAHASNAIGGFIIDAFTFNDTPWDRFMAGKDNAMTERQLAGAQTFMTLKCSICHAGSTFSDEQFHNVAVTQFGPGQGNGPSQRDDFGRMNVTALESDRYRFRTTPLRNVELTAPYGHDGAIGGLRGFVEHYSESDKKLLAFDLMTLEPALRSTVLTNSTAILAQRDTLLNGVVLTEALVNDLMAYMSALTDEKARNLSSATPKRVPSGLSIDKP